MTDDTIKIQMRSADEVRATKRVVLYKDGCEREFYHPKAEWEWCQGCKEHDQENHCCPRWTKAIRKTVAELEEHYGKHITKHDQTLVIDYPDTDDIKTIIVMDDEGFTRVFEERRSDEFDT